MIYLRKIARVSIIVLGAGLGFLGTQQFMGGISKYQVSTPISLIGIAHADIPISDSESPEGLSLNTQIDSGDGDGGGGGDCP